MRMLALSVQHVFEEDGSDDMHQDNWALILLLGQSSPEF